MNILNMMDAIHHFRNVTLFNTLAGLNILHSGYDPSMDAYVTKLRIAGRIDIILSKMKFADVKEVRVNPALPFSSTTLLPYHAKKKYKVWLPDGTVQKHASAEHLARALEKLRANLLEMGLKQERIQQNKDSHAQIKKLAKEKNTTIPIPHRIMKARTGHRPSPLGCVPARYGDVVIQNLRTGAVITRSPMFFDTTRQSTDGNAVSARPSVH